ncbi:MAG TPA: MoaD/ThiS family protein [Candidatus Korarchaeota archaeon]|nr:MoaD/ThiS family protein [Candidatus Korarchaeota archaeon]
MRVRFKLFSIFREEAGASEVEVQVEEGATILDAVKELAKVKPRLRDRLLDGDGTLKRGFHLMRDERWPKPDEKVKDGDLIIIFPPVGGG